MEGFAQTGVLGGETRVFFEAVPPEQPGGFWTTDSRCVT